MRTPTVQLTDDAQAGGYAVPAVNVFDEFSMRGAVRAAERTASPMIIQISVKTVKMLGFDLVTHIFQDIAGSSPMPFSLHLDHCPDRTVLSGAIESGWESVLFDASTLELEEAIKQTTEVVAEARARGVAVESEVENIIGVEDGVGSGTALHSYTEEQLAAAARETGVDLLAPQVGTAHGMYTADPVLRPDRVARLRELAPQGVVLHGGTGLSDQQFADFVAAGVCKINLSTICKHAYLKAGLEHLEKARAANSWDPPRYFTDVQDAVTDALAHFPEVFGSAGRAQAATP